jgi:predicted esterase
MLHIKNKILLITFLLTGIYSKSSDFDFICDIDSISISTKVYNSTSPIINIQDGSFIQEQNDFQPIVCKTQADIYMPIVDSVVLENNKFPLAIICHGAGTTRTIMSATVKSIATEFAKRGFVAAIIDYRLDGQAVFHNLNNILQSNYINERIIFDSTKNSNAAYHTSYMHRVLYSNALDIINAITYFNDNATLYNIDTTKIVIGGHSLGAANTFCLNYYDKEEIEQHFPTDFFTNNNYYDLKRYKNNIKMVFGFGGTILDTSYIDITENTPIFMFHGTHDAASPFYIGTQLCSYLGNAPTFYGSAAIAEKINLIDNNDRFSYYFVQANGVGHNPFPNSSSMSSPFPRIYWANDFYRFLFNSVYFSHNNKIYKKTSAINDSIGYCNNAYLSSDDTTALSYYWLNTFEGNDTTLCGIVRNRCLNIPDLHLQTKNWNDSLQLPCNDKIGAINNKTFSDNICSLEYFPVIQQITSTQNNVYSGEHNKIVVYPNPFQEKLIIENKDNQDLDKIILLNNFGQKIIETNSNTSKVEISTIQLSNGIYFLNILSGKNNHILKILK